MTKDLNKDIFNIDYNHLNLPTKIMFEGAVICVNKNITYFYDATGVKLKKTVSPGMTTDLNCNTIPFPENHTQYDGSFIYEIAGASNSELKFFSHPKCYVEPDGGGFEYLYQYKDHLGNIRLSYKETTNGLEIVEENNYYPFGLKHKGYNENVTSSNPALKRKYNCIELEDALGLYLYEMDMRQYDPAIARWTSIDPVTHWNMSTYNAFDNNPIFWADPSGANGGHYNVRTGRYEDSQNKEVSFETAMKSQGLNTVGSECKECKTKYQAKNFNYELNEKKWGKGNWSDGGYFDYHGGGDKPISFYKALTSKHGSSVYYVFSSAASIETFNKNMDESIDRLNLLSSLLASVVTGGFATELQLGAMGSNVVTAATSFGSFMVGPIDTVDLILNPGESIQIDTIVDTFRSTTNDIGDNGLLFRTVI